MIIVQASTGGRSEMTPVESFIVSEATAASAAVSAATAALSKTEAGVSAVVDCTAAVSRQDVNGGIGTGGIGTAVAVGADANAGEEEEGNKPLDLSWPEGIRKQITYVFLAPILWPLWLTLPDTKTPQGMYTTFPLLSIFESGRIESKRKEKKRKTTFKKEKDDVITIPIG